MLSFLAALATLAGPGDPPTFARDVAPIVYRSCVPCHRPGEAAPFALLSYEDVRKRAAQIVRVTESRYMPPWLPAQGEIEFEDDRSLASEEIATLRAWLEAGSPEGDAAATPPVPEFSSEWELGEPDLVITMPEAYTVPAEGRDVYRNFVIPRPVQAGTRYVRALQFRPDNRAVLHHAVLFVDGSRYARGEDRRDPEPGYPAMGLGVLRPPNGQFVSWTPGKGAQSYDEGIAWTLDDTLDVVLQLHLRPTGRPEPIRVGVGLYFADEPPTEHPLAIRLWSRDIDIPAGDPAYVVESEYTLPVDVQVYGVYPHAHYLGKDLRGWAVLPDGSERTLIHIPSWDFSWQEEYFYRESVSLPAGAVVHMRWVFDNSAENPLNPHSPPVRVRHGYQSSDEMAELQLQVLTAPYDRPILWHDFVQLSYTVDQRNVERGLELMPRNRQLREEAFKYCLRRGDGEGALVHAQALVELTDGSADAWTRVGQALLAKGEAEEARTVLERALALEPNAGRTLFQLGRAHERAGRLDEALARYRQVLARDPRNFMANAAAGEVLEARGEREQAASHLATALSSNPEHLRALWNLAYIELEGGDAVRARERCQQALEIAADEAGAHWVLGLAAEREGRMDEARARYELAVRFEPEEPRFAAALERVLRGAAESAPAGGAPDR